MAKFKVKINDCRLIVKVRLSISEKINERELDFFSRKYLRGFFKARLIQKFGRNTIEYTGPVGISLQERLKKPVSKYDFLFILEQIVDMVQKIKLNALNAEKVLWDIHHVYINGTTRELQFIYLPLEQAKERADLLEFVFNIIYSMIPMADQNSDYISRLSYFLKGLQAFDADAIEKFISKEDSSIVNTIKKHYAGQSGYMTDKPKDYYAHYDDDEKTGLLEEAETDLLEEYNETDLLTEEEETGLLEDTPVFYPSLYRPATGETITVNKPVFRLGKEKSYADYFVSNNNAVSRSHADIITRDSRCFVMDLNSKNRTYINDIPLPVQQEVEIKNGDRLKLANEEFIFYF